MGPQVILDKSALQSLSKDEAFQLGNYLLIVIPPVLLAEIQADLTKASHAKKSQRTTLRNEAAEQAEKLHSMTSRGFNIPRRLLILQDLVGHPVGMDGRPVVGGTPVVTEEGERGFWVDDQQERILFAWRGGDFSAMDKISAYEWRVAISQIDLPKTRERLIQQHGSKDIPRTPAQLLDRVEAILGNAHGQKPLIELQAAFAHADPAARLAILGRWERTADKRLATFAPYAAYCARVLLLFHFALLGGLIGTRPSNRVDLEYLFYIPFAKAFASGDAVHATLAPLAFNDGQPFISRDALKEDAVWLHAETERLITSGAKLPIRYPPERPGSPVLGLWKKHMLPREEIEREMPKMSPEQEAKLVKKLEAMRKARPIR